MPLTLPRRRTWSCAPPVRPSGSAPPAGPVFAPAPLTSAERPQSAEDAEGEARMWRALAHRRKCHAVGHWKAPGVQCARCLGRCPHCRDDLDRANRRPTARDHAFARMAREKPGRECLPTLDQVMERKRRVRLMFMMLVLMG